MATATDVIKADEAKRICEKHSCCNIAVIMMIAASMGIRNFATCRFDVLISHWKNMVIWYAKENTDFYRSQLQMNLLNAPTATASAATAQLNPASQAAFFELLLALYAQSYTNNPSELPKRPKAGISGNFKDVCMRYYNKMKLTGRLPLYDPYRIMGTATVRPTELRTSQVLHVLVYGYPDNLLSASLNFQQFLQDFRVVMQPSTGSES